MKKAIEAEYKESLEKFKAQAQLDAERSKRYYNFKLSKLKLSIFQFLRIFLIAIPLTIDIQDIERNIHHEN
jgi:hypothetical protein